MLSYLENGVDITWGQNQTILHFLATSQLTYCGKFTIIISINADHYLDFK